MKKVSAIIFTITFAAMTAGIAVAGPAPGTGISGSKHDLSGLVPTETQLCIYCHAPHNGTGAAGGLLWNHSPSAATYNMYTEEAASDPAFANFIDGAQDAEPTGSAKLCLSCHDGTVAIDAYGGSAGTINMTAFPNANLGTDLSDDHPISIVYDDAADLGLNPIASVNLGAVDLADILENGKINCVACHDVHNSPGETVELPFLRVTKVGSEICLRCHDK